MSMISTNPVFTAYDRKVIIEYLVSCGYVFHVRFEKNPIVDMMLSRSYPEVVSIPDVTKDINRYQSPYTAYIRIYVRVAEGKFRVTGLDLKKSEYNLLVDHTKGYSKYPADTLTILYEFIVENFSMFEKDFTGTVVTIEIDCMGNKKKSIVKKELF